jgi:hypothetical protein
MGRQLGWDARSGLSHTEIIEFTLNMENINQTVGRHVSCKGLHGNFSVWEFDPGKQDFGDALREVCNCRFRLWRCSMNLHKNDKRRFPFESLGAYLAKE